MDLYASIGNHDLNNRRKQEFTSINQLPKLALIMQILVQPSTTTGLPYT